jgi:glycerophosphoryl diester phosphodiesterase
MYLTTPGTLLADKPEVSPWLAGFDPKRLGSVPKAVKAAGGTIWAPNQTYLTPELRREARELGLVVIPWTVNNPEMIVKLLDMGVDGIISDRPDLVKAELQRRGKR